MTRGQVPPRRDVRCTPPGFRNHLAGDEQSELDPDAGEPDPFAALLGARRNVVIARQFPPLHPSAIVHDRQRRRAGVGQQMNARRTRVECVGHNLGEDGLLERTRVGIAKVFEEMVKVDSGFTHADILPARKPSHLTLWRPHAAMASTNAWSLRRHLEP